MKMVQTFGTTLTVYLLGIGALCATESCRTGQQRTAIAEQRDTVYDSESSLVVKGAFTENDTLFFLKEYDKLPEGMLRAAHVYCAKDTNAYEYTAEAWVEHFSDEACRREWNMLQQYRDGGAMALEKVDCFGLPSDWIPLHYYQGVPYVFSSCMVDVPQQRRLTDSLLIHRDMEIFFFPLAGSERVSPTVCHFKLAVDSSVADSPVSGFTDVYIH